MQVKYNYIGEIFYIPGSNLARAVDSIMAQLTNVVLDQRDNFPHYTRKFLPGRLSWHESVFIHPFAHTYVTAEGLGHDLQRSHTCNRTWTFLRSRLKVSPHRCSPRRPVGPTLEAKDSVTGDVETTSHLPILHSRGNDWTPPDNFSTIGGELTTYVEAWKLYGVNFGSLNSQKRHGMDIQYPTSFLHSSYSPL